MQRACSIIGGSAEHKGLKYKGTAEQGSTREVVLSIRVGVQGGTRYRTTCTTIRRGGKQIPCTWTMAIRVDCVDHHGFQRKAVRRQHQDSIICSDGVQRLWEGVRVLVKEILQYLAIFATISVNEKAGYFE